MDRYLIGNVVVDEREKGRPILLFYHNASWKKKQDDKC